MEREFEMAAGGAKLSERRAGRRAHRCGLNFYFIFIIRLDDMAMLQVSTFSLHKSVVADILEAQSFQLIERTYPPC